MRRFGVLAVSLLACSSGVTPPSAAPELGGGRRWLHPPPKPGASIAGSKMCACVSCEPASCCRGADERAEGAGKCDGYDFSAEGCGLTVASCASRCFQQVWRVGVSERCDARRPPECC
ncbi:MAG: hypothetical protein OZ921_09240 [Sorangiineae bacterium]|nr:hypothetical protein [Polyangiaceae bacterium]MEB2322687.1 hypothetical protein [Sorangiineae bacterium]